VPSIDRLMRYLAAACLTLAPLAAGCARSGDITGTVAVTTQSGEMKHGAEITVRIIDRSDEFESALGRLLKTYGEAAGRPGGDYDVTGEATRSAPSASLDQDAYYKDKRSRMERLYALYWTTRRAVGQLAVRQTLRACRTNANGAYAFEQLPSGRYFVFAEYRVNDTDVAWLVPVDLRGGALTVDLSNSNSGIIPTPGGPAE